MTCNPELIIKPSRGNEYIVHPDGGTMDIVRAIMDADKKADSYVQKSGISCLQGNSKYETLRNIWKFVKYNLTYRADRPGYEVVKSPGALFTKGKGDCKSYSISIAALLRAFGFSDIRYRFVSYERGGDYTHVYVVCRLNGKDVILDAVYHTFDKEATYKRKMDVPAKGAAVAGVAGPQVSGDIQDLSGAAMTGAVLLMLYFLFKK